MTDAPATEPLEAAPLATPTRERAFRDVFVQVAARVLNLALGIVVTILVVRILGDSGYGQWMTILTSFRSWGSSPASAWSRWRSARRWPIPSTPATGSARSSSRAWRSRCP